MMRSWLVPFYLFLCLLLGGASAAGLWANALLQLLAALILLVAFLRPAAGPLPVAGRQLLGLAGAMVALVLVQLVPLPPAVWTALPGREATVEAFALIGAPLPWLPISLAPYATLASLLWLLPALAVLVGTLRIGVGGIARLGWTIALVMAASVFLGALQIGGGEGSPWYPYRITNYGVTVGFFANANHMATLLAATLPFLAALYARAQRGVRQDEQKGVRFIAVGALALLVLVGLAINGSLAGLGLMLPVALASVMLVRRGRGMPAWVLGVLALILAGSVAVVLSGRFDNNLISQASYGDPVSRRTIFAETLDATAGYLPFGSGVGTFAPIYRLQEDPAMVTPTYINHAHSDYLELLLETGLFGVLLLLAFLGWWGRQAVAIWRAAEPLYFARAATIASAAILAHSLVDYPLRTAAISAILALCCALMANPRPLVQRERAERPSRRRPARHLSAD